MRAVLESWMLIYRTLILKIVYLYIAVFQSYQLSQILAKITNYSCLLGFQGSYELLWCYFFILEKYLTEAFTFVNRKSALRSCILHEYFQLWPSANTVYCIYMCGICWNNSGSSESWKIEILNEFMAAYWLGKLLLQNRHLGETFSSIPSYILSQD